MKDKLILIKMQITDWRSTKSPSKKPLSLKKPPQGPHKGREEDSFTGYTLGIQMGRDETEDKIRKEAISLQLPTQNYQPKEVCGERDSVHNQGQDLDSFAFDMKEQQHVFLQMQTEIHEKTAEDEQTELGKKHK